MPSLYNISAADPLYYSRNVDHTTPTNTADRPNTSAPPTSDESGIRSQLPLAGALRLFGRLRAGVRWDWDDEESTNPICFRLRESARCPTCDIDEV